MEQRKIPFVIRPRALGNAILVLVIGVLGLVMAHHPMLFSGFRRIQTDLRDTRLIHYLLEHGYLWVCGIPEHRTFWNPPIFYPVSNTAAYSDLLLSVGPVYWLWRAGGASPDLALAGWMISMSAVNYAAALVLFRKGLGFTWLPSASAGFLVAFGAPRVNQISHQQLLPCFYVLMTVFALARLFGGNPQRFWERGGLWLLAVLGVVLQFYSGFYLAWFLMLGIGFAVAAAILLPPCRTVFLEVVQRDLWVILTAGLVGVLLLLPLLNHYLPVARYLARRQYLPMYYAFNPHLWSWFHVGGNHWLWGWTAGREPFRTLGYPPEHLLGFGFITPLACAAGLYFCRERPICRLAAAVTLSMWLATTFLPGKAIALVASGVAYYCLACLFREFNGPRERALGLASVLTLLVLVSFPNIYLQILTLSALMLCSLELVRTRGRPECQVVPGIALGLFCLKLFSFDVLLIGVCLAAPAAALIAYYWVGRRRDVGLGAVLLVVFFTAVTTILDNPNVYLGALAAPSSALLVSAPRRLRPPAWLSVRALIVAMVLVVWFYDQDSLWLSFYNKIPGGIGIRAVGRIVLILLIPAALGLAALVQSLEQKQWTLAAWIVILVCMLEQGVTSESFDAAANQATIAGVARQVTPGREAFYYRPWPNPGWITYHLDAMWASLVTGVPTINGYSGYNPPGWDGFFAVDAQSTLDPRDVLAQWERAHGLPPERIQSIGLDRTCEGPQQTRHRPDGVEDERLATGE